MLNEKNETARKNTQDESFIVTPPTPSLPKGGGAVKGIGEKFTANPVTGTGTFSLPIFTTPSRNDFHPKLSLNYNSGSGNGPFGLGCDISLPEISRKTDKKLPAYKDAEDSDTFILSGAEDLVPSLKEGTLIEDAFEEGNFKVRRYRPRVEGLFARIERLEDKATGNVYWRSVTRDNITSIYGRSEDCRICDPDRKTRVFKWMIEESSDGKGNIIRYEYKAESRENIDRALPQEKNKLSGGFANKYIKTIKYGNKTMNQHDWSFQIVFDYGEHSLDAPSVAEDGEWLCRRDAFSNCRAGFEIRAYRLCRRALMFHHFPELGSQWCLVRSTDFNYKQTASASFLISATQTGYIKDGADGYIKQSFPPLELTYTEPTIDPTVHFVEGDDAENLPAGVDGFRYQWVDLDGEGLSGVLTEQAGAWFYKRNLGNGRFAPLQLVATKPSPTDLQSGRQQIMDLAGDGLKYLARFDRPVAGYFKHADNNEWEPFTPFSLVPNIAWDDPNVKFIDLDGDGIADVLVDEDDLFVWYPSRAEEGFGPCEFARKFNDEEKGPALVFADATESIYLTDMIGDGLTDIVRIRNGEVSYWPNLGYGRFGRQVTMHAAPYFDHPDLFDQKRIRLGDIDGSGTTDIIYLDDDAITLWINESGNSWSEPRHLTDFPPTDNLSSVMVVDFLGNGTSCIVWSSPLPAGARNPIRYIDLMSGQKPHLLNSVKNNIGMETRIGYAPSTRFYIDDFLAGTPWLTRLPFPVQTVEQVETRDLVTGTKLVSHYRYHHGYYDREEREFRGFGLVEQWDTQEMANFTGAGLFSEPPAPVDDELYCPPVLTKTWFHTGAYQEGDSISKQFASEYYDGGDEAPLLLDTLLPPGLSAREQREACRALKGSLLRREVYAVDGTAKSPHPYTVSESNYHIKRMQRQREDSPAVFYVCEGQSLSFHYERDESVIKDPRVIHRMNLDVDPYGNVTKSAEISYGRSLSAFDEQLKTSIVYTESDFINKADEASFYRVGLPCGSRTYEVTGVNRGPNEFFTLSKIIDEVEDADPLEYHEDTQPGVTQKRLIESRRLLYFDDDLSGPLPFKVVGALGLPYESYRATYTPGLIDQVYEDRLTDDMLTQEGKYIFESGLWWSRSGRIVFDAQHFYLPVQTIDVFGSVFNVEYDDYQLLMIKAGDPLGNIVEADNDYRTMAARQVIEPNGNGSQVQFDALGMIVATAVMGKQGEGDTLADPTARFEYDLFNWMKPEPRPIFVRTFAREQHGSSNPRWQQTYVYSDGLGREVMKKVQAEPGMAPARDASGALKLDANNKLILEHTNSRWVGTGRTVYDNKGNPVKKYEPFFSSTHEYEDEADLTEWGVTPILRYDPLGRLIRTDAPNGTFSKEHISPWSHVIWDSNDTVEESKWLADRLALDPANLANAPEIRAATLTQAHAETPTVAHLDNLGRVFLTLLDNKAAGQYQTRRDLDIEGNERAVIDARNKNTLVQKFDMLGRKIKTVSGDAGARWIFMDVTGKPARRWNSRDYQSRSVFDELQRPTHLFAQQGNAAEALVERMVYGETLDAAVALSLNMRGKLYQHYDSAGVVTNLAFDFKGNLLSSERRLASNYQNQVDWIAISAATSADDIMNAASPLLVGEAFVISTAYDALSRPTSLITPDQSETRPTYNEANLLERIEVRLRGAADWTLFVDDIDYDAKGQREQIVYGNGVRTQYSYDPLTLRLANLKTLRVADNAKLQDLSYAYDPVGNILEIRDDAQQTVFFDNAIAEPRAQYVYDSIYRLIEASGREHGGQVADTQRDQTDFPILPLPHPNDAQAMRRYTELYEYDSVGNLLRMIHKAPDDRWVRRYAYSNDVNSDYADDSNRVLSTSLPADNPNVRPFSALYDYDAHGNMTKMPHLVEMQWDFRDQLCEADLGGGGTAYYVYDATGQRVRKVVEKLGVTEERIYLGIYEVFRRHNGSGIELERETLHVLDDTHRIALVETKTIDNATPVASPTPLTRYQLSNHLGSASLELNEAGLVISYEEYYPYGNTSYHMVASGVEVSLKRYRHTGKEHDDETGLYYHGARYYAPWLGRWTAADPAGLIDGVNLYAYSRDNPINFTDPTGMQGEKWFRIPAYDAESGDVNYKRYGSSEGRVAEEMVFPQAEIKSTQKPPPPKPPPPKPPTPPPPKPPEPKPEPVKEPKPEEKEVEEEEEEGSSWKDNEVVQFLAGAAAGGLQGWLPGGALASLVPMPTRTVEMGRAVGEGLMGVAQLVVGVTGATGGALLMVTGLGTIPGIAVEAVSVAVMVQGASNVIGAVYSFKQAMNSSSPSSGGGGAPKPKPRTQAEAAKLSKQNVQTLESTKDGQALVKRYNAEKAAMDPERFVDFKDYLYPKGPNDVNIGSLRGTRDLDFQAANELCGYSSTPAGYTWHHHQDLGRMQLVKSSVHSGPGLYHSGGVSIWKKLFPSSYP